MDKTETALEKEKIAELFASDCRMDGSEIEIKIKGGTVILTGNAPGALAKRAAEYNAWSARGVGFVDNRIVSAGEEDPAEPLVLKDLLRRKLTMAPEIDTRHVRISSAPAKIIFEGAVLWEWQKRRLEKLAFQIPRVAEVINKLAVVPDDHPQGRRIGESLADLFYEDVFIDVNTVDFRIEDGGTVILSGYVEEPEDKVRAGDLCREVAQVTAVENFLCVK